MAYNSRRFSNVNGKATVLGKPLTVGSYLFISLKAGTMSAKSIAEILHRPVGTVRSAARRLGVSLAFNG